MIMTPKEFADKMQSINMPGDPEISHGLADKLMCKLLIELGYEEGIEIFEIMEKWYA